ncbi:MAG: endonuclease domain-containing protein [bacterium]
MSHSHEAVKRARALRSPQTPAEELLWRKLRRAQLLGMRSRRQQPYGPYILDFYCKKAQLAIEIDGDSHAEKEKEDNRRDVCLNQHGLKVIRFYNSDVYENIDGVLQVIYDYCVPFAGEHEEIEKGDQMDI